MPRGFCDGSGAIKNSLGLLIGLGCFFFGHLASRILDRGVDLIHEGIHLSIQSWIGNVIWNSRLICGRHAMRSLFPGRIVVGHTVYPSGQVLPGHYHPGNLLDYDRTWRVAALNRSN